MWTLSPHIAVLFQYTYKIWYFFVESRRRHIYYGFYIFIYGFDAILCYPETLIFHFGLSNETLFNIIFNSFSLQIYIFFNFNECTWYVQYTQVKMNRSFIYAQMNSNPRNKSLIFCWKKSGEFATPIGRSLYQMIMLQLWR